MVDVEAQATAGEPEIIRLTDLSDDFLREAGVPEACFVCSTARSRALRGRFDRECLGPTDTIETMGAVITSQFCRYPTGPQNSTLEEGAERQEALKTDITVYAAGERGVQVGQDGPTYFSPSPTVKGYKDYTPERMRALLFLIDNQDQPHTYRYINRQANRGRARDRNVAASVRDWLFRLKTTEGEHIVKAFKEDGLWYMRSAPQFNLIADTSFREAVEQLGRNS